MTYLCCMPSFAAGDEQAGAASVGNATERLSAGDFATRFLESYRLLWCIAASVVRRKDDVEDVLQEAAAVGLRKLDRFEPGTNYGAWMGRIVHNVARNYARKRARREVIASDPVHMDARPDDAAPAAAPVSSVMTSDGRLRVDQRGFDDRVVAALHSLNETARACILLRTVCNLSYADISRVLDVPEGTAMSHVHRARHALRERLASEYSHASAKPDSQP